MTNKESDKQAKNHKTSKYTDRMTNKQEKERKYVIVIWHKNNSLVYEEGISG